MSLVSAWRTAILGEENSFFGFLNQIKSRKYALDKITISWREQSDKSDFGRNIFFVFYQNRMQKYALSKTEISLAIQM